MSGEEAQGAVSILTLIPKVIYEVEARGSVQVT